MSQRRLLLVLGPESSGTRWVADTLSSHPDVLCGTEAHLDPLDSFWSEPSESTLNSCLPPSGVFVSRRSLPSGVADAPAKFRVEPPLELLLRCCERWSIPVFLVLTTRSASALVMSGAAKRASNQGSIVRARQQYQWAYRLVFEQICSNPELPFVFVALESLLDAPADAFESLFVELGLPAFRPPVKARSDINRDAHQLLPRVRSFARIREGWQVDFNKGASGTELLGTGWGKPEDNGVWTIARCAYLTLPYPECDDSPMPLRPLIRIGCVPFLDNQRQSSCTIRIGIDQVDRSEIPLSGPCTLLLPLSLSAVRRDLMVIEFQIVEGAGDRLSSSDENSVSSVSDLRFFGIKLRSLSFEVKRA